MTSRGARVVLFPDTYSEIDGVANTCRHFEDYAVRQNLPLLTIFGGKRYEVCRNGSALRIEFPRGPFGFPLDRKHYFDLAFWRHYPKIERQVRQFCPDVIHVTGPSDVGQLGALLAHRLRVPLAASWHTNLHQYAEQRAARLTPWLPQRWNCRLGKSIRNAALRATLRFYKIPRLLFAPNQELVELLHQGTGKPCYLMARGVDTHLFHPARRDSKNEVFTLGYVGRLTTEKNIRALHEIEQLLEAEGIRFRFLIAGQGGEESWLRFNLRHAEFLGVLRGEDLARAYANMDAFVFPSMTDTYGNVVLEAMASGVPAVVTNSGGPQFIVRHGETGFVAKNPSEFVTYSSLLAQDRSLLLRMRESARAQALGASWDQVFDSVYTRYEKELTTGACNAGRRMRPQARVAASL